MQDQQQLYMATCDLEYKVTSWNLIAEATFGLASDKVIGQQLPEVICAKEFTAACYAIFLEVRNQGFEWEGEMLARRQDGRLFQSQVKISRMENATGELVGLVAIGKDLTKEEVEASERVGFAQYLVGECNLSPQSAFTYEQGLLRLERHLGKDATEITADDVRRFMRVTDYHPATKGSTLVSIKAFHRWGALEGKWDLNGIMALRAPKNPRNPKPSLSIEDARAFLATCKRPNEFRVIYLGLYAGLRITESSSITANEWLGDRLRFVGKGRKVREVPLHPRLVEVKDEILAGSPTRGTLKHTMASLAFYTGVDATSHALRRTFATTLIEAGVQEGVVIDLLGHAPNTVLRSAYAPVSWKEKVQAISRLDYPERTLPGPENVAGGE